MSKEQWKFRGKDKETGEWVYGSHVWIDSTDYIYTIEAILTEPETDFYENQLVPHLVISDSVGLWTGRKDRDGKEIYGGDIIKLCYGIPPTFDTLIIEYADNETVSDISVSGWWMRNVRPNGCSSSLCKTYEGDIEVIGTIHGNPELLEGK
jgi:uncharacterized phage protein (TIGR01671 family)